MEGERGARWISASARSGHPSTTMGVRAELAAVADRLEGKHDIARARFHFHPHIEVALHEAREGRVIGADGLTASFLIKKGRAWLEDATYHPEFGRSIRNQCLVVELEHAESVIVFTFGP